MCPGKERIVSRLAHSATRTLTVILGVFLIDMAAGPATEAQTWTVTWSDEFDGTGALDGNTWTYDLGNGYSGWGNNELEYYQYGTANANQGVAFAGSSTLDIQARVQSVGGKAYTSARVKTQGRRSFGPGDAAPAQIEGRLP